MYDIAEVTTVKGILSPEMKILYVMILVLLKIILMVKIGISRLYVVQRGKNIKFSCESCLPKFILPFQ